jgi:hypothetical protein
MMNEDQGNNGNGNNGSRALTAQDILNLSDSRIERVEVPEWGGHVYVRSLSGTERERYIESIRELRGRGRKQDYKIILAESGAKLAVRTMCDEKGNLMFTAADVKKLGEKSSKALQRVIDVAGKLNGLDDESEEEAKNDSPGATATV